MNQAQYIKAIERENARCSREWEDFLSKFAPMAPEAVQLAEKQGERIAAIDKAFNDHRKHYL